MRARGASGPAKARAIDRALWERSRDAEASPDETERFLDLAGFVDDRLDEDERQRVAALIARDPMAAADAAAARALMAAPMPSVGERIVERAVALADPGETRGEVVSFPPPRSAPPRWFGAAAWSSLAAGIVLAGWFGFNLGSNLPGVTSVARPYDDLAANELLDPSPLLSRDYADGSPI